MAHKYEAVPTSVGVDVYAAVQGELCPRLLVKLKERNAPCCARSFSRARASLRIEPRSDECADLAFVFLARLNAIRPKHLRRNELRTDPRPGQLSFRPVSPECLAVSRAGAAFDISAPSAPPLGPSVS